MITRRASIASSALLVAAIERLNGNGETGMWIHRESTAEPFHAVETVVKAAAWSPTVDRVAFNGRDGSGRIAFTDDLPAWMRSQPM